MPQTGKHDKEEEHEGRGDKDETQKGGREGREQELSLFNEM